MCIISAEEEEADRQVWLKVTKTDIFARHTRQGYQAIAYSLSIASRTEAAMILPLPVEADGGEEALRFIDLSGFPDFFDCLSSICQQEYQSTTEDFDSMAGETNDLELLTVHDVGDFQASYVPTMADFDRLDPRFRLPSKIWNKMPDYSDYGFAVFQLKLALSDSDEARGNDVHPMAFEFATRDSQNLFYPTVHVHDGDYHNEAGFYHRLYCQRPNARAEFKYQLDLLHGQVPSPAMDYHPNNFLFEGYPWYFRSADVAGNLLEINKCEGIVAPDRELHAIGVWGQFPNKDIWLGESFHQGQV